MGAFNPFPITGENPYNQPSNQNIAPILPYNKGGIPDTSAGIKKRYIYRKKNIYILQITTASQGINGLNTDSVGQVGFIDIGKLCAWNSPFVFIPDIYSVILVSSGTADDLSLESWHVGLYDSVAQDELFGSSPPNPNSTFQKLGFEIPLPILQHDDFEDISDRNYLNFLNNIYLVLNGSMINNSALVQNLTVYQTLIYRLEKLQV